VKDQSRKAIKIGRRSRDPPPKGNAKKLDHSSLAMSQGV
jgi:hypothetical protein